jgi:hypothetical protein
VGPLGGGAGGPRAPTISAKKCQRQAPWEVLLEVEEHPPSMQKLLTVSTMGGGAGGPGAPTINAKNIDAGPVGR